MKSLNEIVAELRMGDDGGKPAYRIGRADKVEVSMPSGTPMRSYVIEYVTIKELADWIEAAVARERESCNAAAMREALENIAGYAETARCHTEDAHVLGYLEQIEKWAKEALSAPPRNCDVGTAEDQAQRFHDFCAGNSSGINGMCKPTCPCIDCFDKCQCLTKWAQTPYAAQEGARE